MNCYEQSDQNVDDVMVLDGGDEIYVWVGAGATEEEREKAQAMAERYVEREPSARRVETVSFVRVEQGGEPRSFKRLFPTWSDDMWQMGEVEGFCFFFQFNFTLDSKHKIIYQH